MRCRSAIWNNGMPSTACGDGGTRTASPRYAHAPAGASRRLRIGYVSADLREHATAGFIRPILTCHDRETFDVFCYNNSDEADALTQDMQRRAHRWRAITGMDDARAAQLIHADAIDILVDLSGHTRGNRLGVFARKPAPVQIGYLGYLNTSGMAAMDYRITDASADPPGASDRLHSETLLRLPQTLWCYQPPADAPSVASPPAQRNGYITFGSFNHIAKLNERVLNLWAELLRRLPASRLRVMALPDEEAAARIRAAMEKRGIDAARIRTLPRLARGQYWGMFGEVDIALDPFPYTGGATTCDSLWMGLPVVTLAGSFGFGRSGTTVLANAGLADLVAVDERHYLDCRAARRCRAGAGRVAPRHARTPGALAAARCSAFRWSAGATVPGGVAAAELAKHGHRAERFAAGAQAPLFARAGRGKCCCGRAACRSSAGNAIAAAIRRYFQALCRAALALDQNQIQAWSLRPHRPG